MAKQHREKQAGVSLDRLREMSESQEIKLHGAISNEGKTFPRYEQDPYNNYQNCLYNRVLFGLSMYPQEEVRKMSREKRKRIINLHKRAQVSINLWKQEIINTLSNYFFETIFPGTPITKELTGTLNDVNDDSYNNKMSFKSLHIKKEQVVARFIDQGILPKKFNELTTESDANRISSKRKPDTSVKPREHVRRGALEVSDKAG